MADGPVQSLRDAIDEKIAGSGPEVRELAIDHFVVAEKKRRSDILVAAVTAQRGLESDLRKINRPDQPFFDADGNQTVAHFTKGRLTEIKKLNDKASKLNAAISKVLVDNPSNDDYAKLEKAINAAKSKDGGGARDGDGDGDEE